MVEGTLSKKQLGIILSQLKIHPDPDPKLEQYEIPGELASDILNFALLSGHIRRKEILDLGCGTGRLGIGTALLGAKKVIGIDIDPKSVEIAEENIKIAEELSKKSISDKIELVETDIGDWNGRVDTVIQNPPFGIQKEHADRVFVEKALESGKVIYSLHRSYSKSRMFLTKYVEQHGGMVEKVMKYNFRMTRTFDFHTRPAVIFDVDLYVIRKTS